MSTSLVSLFTAAALVTGGTGPLSAGALAGAAE